MTVCKVAWELIRPAWSSPASLAVTPLQDLLNLGPEARMNLPGSAEGNWRWRCTDEILSEIVFERLNGLTATTDRTPRNKENRIEPRNLYT